MPPSSRPPGKSHGLVYGPYWGVRLGKGGEYADLGRERGFVAIGWKELGDHLSDERRSGVHGPQDRDDDRERQTGNIAPLSPR